MAPQSREAAPWYNPLEKDGSKFMDCVVYGLEHSIDILSCDDSKFNVAAHPQKPRVPLIPIDYAKRHDEFLESLLQEQEALLKAHGTRSVLMTSSSSTLDDSNSERLDEGPKKRRPLKLSRRSPARKSPLRNPRKVAPMLDELDDVDEDDDDVSSPVGDDESLVSKVSISVLPDPPSYIHPQCRLQKDKGKGEVIGSDICATGKDACLEKLRQKMELLTHVALGGDGKKKAKSASMKRRKAKVSEVTPYMTETRSVIDLKMGFLSMQYGVLLRWDREGLVTLCVLRKMCHESFFQKEVVKTVGNIVSREAPPIVLKTDGSNHVILQRWDGTEVTLLEPPYRVDQPLSFEPAVMSLTILKLEGFDQRATYTVHCGLDGFYHKARCQLSGDLIRPIVNRPMEWQLSSDLELSLAVSLYEQKRPRHRRKKLLTKEIVAVNLLDGNRVSQNRLLVLPVDKQGTIHFNVLIQSDYCQWLYQELDARKREETWRAPFYPVYIEEPQLEKEKDEDFVWQLCCTF